MGMDARAYPESESRLNRETTYSPLATPVHMIEKLW
jgi:hypothetical protein